VASNTPNKGLSTSTIRVGSEAPDKNISMNFFPLPLLVWRDVTRGNHMHQSSVRPGSAAAAVPAIAATAGEYSSDEILVERIAAGDKLAMKVLFARHRTYIYRWLFRFVGNETVAEDLLSDVFFDVWQQAARFEGRSAVTTWLLAIARFKALSACRRRTDAPLDETIETTVADSADDPEMVLQKKSRSELVRQALTTLSPDHREIIDLGLLPREVHRGLCAHPRHPGRHGEDPHVTNRAVARYPLG
jgi:RNA polymerase sigma-70 factor (ECF subfamily)